MFITDCPPVNLLFQQLRSNPKFLPKQTADPQVKYTILSLPQVFVYHF